PLAARRPATAIHSPALCKARTDTVNVIIRRVAIAADLKERCLIVLEHETVNGVVPICGPLIGHVLFTDKTNIRLCQSRRSLPDLFILRNDPLNLCRNPLRNQRINALTGLGAPSARYLVPVPISGTLGGRSRTPGSLSRSIRRTPCLLGLAPRPRCGLGHAGQRDQRAPIRARKELQLIRGVALKPESRN